MSDTPEPEIYVKLSLSFKAIRVVQNRLVPTTWNFTTDVIYDDKSPQPDIEISGALAKIRYWFNHVMDGSVIFDRNNKWAINAFLSNTGSQSVDNTLVILPEEPSDEILAQIFQSKMNALANCFITFGAVEIVSDDTQGLSFLFTGDGELNLPKMEEWVGERSYFSKPWWGRNDASTIDVVPKEGSDLSDIPKFAVSLDFIVDQMRPQNDTKGQIIRREFRPQVIDGGK